MGGALFAALEGRQQLANPAQAFQRLPDDGSGIHAAVRGNHPGLFAKAQKEDSNIMMVSTISRVGDKNVVKQKPFMKIKSAMALASLTNVEYPAFNALAVFSESGKSEILARNMDFMYGADVESEVTLNITSFPYNQMAENQKRRQHISEIEEQVRFAASKTDSRDTYQGALAFFDSERFSLEENEAFLSSGDVTITAENVSVLQKHSDRNFLGERYEERFIEVRAEASISEVFLSEGLNIQEASEIDRVLSSDLGTSLLQKGDVLQSYFRYQGQSSIEGPQSIERVSVFRGKTHLVSVARTDDQRFVYAIPPESASKIISESGDRLNIPNTNLPSVYDGIYRAALAEGLTEKQAGELVRIFAFDVDFKSRIKPEDTLEAFVSIEDGKETATENSEILYAAITLGGLKRKYYRFTDEQTGIVDYYDEDGKSAKKFLLRKPVPAGRFRSPYGKRWHPILKYRKMHWGVDWAAPRGTPIIAAGNGVVKEAGWSGSGYGKQTIIRHANGYETSYSHQTAIAKGIRSGVRVKQGQIIGYVGSTGLSTGPHLHYEVSVNSNRVDPMRIRLPQGKVLKDSELAAFEEERDRIAALVDDREDEGPVLASN